MQSLEHSTDAPRDFFEPLVVGEVALSANDTKVALLLSVGYTLDQVASELSVPPQTLQHVCAKSLYPKLGVSDAASVPHKLHVASWERVVEFAQSRGCAIIEKEIFSPKETEFMLDAALLLSIDDLEKKYALAKGTIYHYLSSKFYTRLGVSNRVEFSKRVVQALPERAIALSKKHHRLIVDNVVLSSDEARLLYMTHQGKSISEISEAFGEYYETIQMRKRKLLRSKFPNQHPTAVTQKVATALSAER